jgi:hypothetical protein
MLLTNGGLQGKEESHALMVQKKFITYCVCSMHGANLGINFWLWGIDISSTLLIFWVTFQLIIH